MHPISLLSTTGKLIEKLILWTVQKHIEALNLLSASEFGVQPLNSIKFQCMKLTHQVTIVFNSNMLAAVVFVDIEKALDILYKLLKLEFWQVSLS
jgi:hypothetical protein